MPATVSTAATAAPFLTLLWVMLGGAVGAAARYGVSAGVGRVLGHAAVPWGTLAVNVMGCLIVGYIAGRVGQMPDEDWWLLRHRPLLVTGFCGALTTFSTFGFEVIDLWEKRGATWAIGLVTLHLVLGLGAVAVGLRSAGTAF